MEFNQVVIFVKSVARAVELDKLLQTQMQAEITEQKQVPLISALHEIYMDDPEVLDRAWKRIPRRR